MNRIPTRPGDVLKEELEARGISHSLREIFIFFVALLSLLL
jgi:hypothetical protein